MGVYFWITYYIFWVYTFEITIIFLGCILLNYLSYFLGFYFWTNYHIFGCILLNYLSYFFGCILLHHLWYSFRCILLHHLSYFIGSILWIAYHIFFGVYFWITYFIFWVYSFELRRFSASKILQSEGLFASNWRRLLFSSPKWLKDGARLSENSMGQGCSLRRSTDANQWIIKPAN